MAPVDGFQNLANKIGVESVPLGRITIVEGRDVGGVTDAIMSSGLKFVGYADGRHLEPNTAYIRVNGDLLAAKIPNTPTEVEGLPPKPDGYKDGYRWVGF